MVQVVAEKHVDSAPVGLPEQEFLETAYARFRASADNESRMRAEQILDQEFMSGEQWPANVKGDREADGRACLTVNRLPVFKRQITNQQREAKPAIQINPVDSFGDPKVAEVLQGIIRQIELNSDADVAYDTACDSQVTIGRGFFRLIVEWDDIETWQQNIKIRRIRNPFTVFFDPACQEVDYSDARYCFVVEDMPKDEFRQKYGDAVEGRDEFAYLGDRSADWMPEGKVRVAEYFYVDLKHEKISLLSNHKEMPTAALKSADMQAWMAAEGITEIRSRTVTTRSVKWAKINGTRVLERGEWAGQWIPIIPVIGDEYDVNGMVDLKGMVRDARDPQRMYNYWISAETETIALAPKAPFVGVEGQFEGHETKWNSANRRNWPYLEYKNKSLNGQNAPPPQRQVLEPPIQAIAIAARQADNDLKATTGLYDASLGERGPEESGRAILARQKQGDMSTSHWMDNLLRSIRFLGRQLVQLIPKIYDVPRVLRIVGADNQPSMVMVHAGNEEAIDDTAIPEGVKGIYDIGVGRYDVTATVGPSYQSRRQEAVNAMLAFIQAFPPAAPAMGDVLAENMDWPGASTVAKRLKRMVPPQLLSEEGDGASVEQMSQQVAQAKQMLEALQGELQQAKMTIDTQQVQAQSRERIAAMQEQTKVQLALMDRETSDGLTQVQAQSAQAKSQADVAKSLSQVQSTQSKTALERARAATEMARVDADTRISEGQQAIERARLIQDRELAVRKLAHEQQMLDDEQQHERDMLATEQLHDARVEVHKATTARAIAKTRKPNYSARAKRPGGK